MKIPRLSLGILGLLSLSFKSLMNKLNLISEEKGIKEKTLLPSEPLYS
jgi:hypothetical protein